MSNSVSPSNLTPSKPEIAAAAQTAASKPNPVVNDSVEPMSREVRLGLVLYGGVSLAIYMNGVANEFFNAMRGRGIYRLIKVLTDSHVVVDIISGASAGGVNGIFLAYALCNESEFQAFAKLWREQGDVSLLLRDPRKEPDDCHSLFDSKGKYQSYLQGAFDTASPQKSRIPDETRKAELVSNFKEMDVFIAGSDVEGRVFTTFDDLGATIDVKDHRVIFQLKHRKGRKEPFNPDFESQDQPRAGKEITYESLAKLARLTSCFPAAFEPVQVEWTDKKPDLPSADGRLQQWGTLQRDAFFQAGKYKYFVDGGVLNNKPFTSTLDEILYRMADSDVERFLMYVEPDPERFEPPEGPFPEPPFSTTILDSLISLPGYQSIASDLQALAEHNTEVERYERLTAQFRSEVTSDPRRTLELASSPSYALYTRARLAVLSERVVRGVLREDGADPLLKTPRQKGAAKQLLPEFDQLLGCMNDNDQQDILNQFDVYFPQRQLFEVVHRIKTLLYPPEPIKPPEDCQAGMKTFWENENQYIREAQGKRSNYTRLWLALNRQIDLLQIVQTAAEDMVDQARLPWPRRKPKNDSGPHEISTAEVWHIVEAMLQKLLDANWIWDRVAKQVQEGRIKATDLELNYGKTWPQAAGATDKASKREDWSTLDRAQLESGWLSEEWLSALNLVLQTRSKNICAALPKNVRDSKAQEFMNAVQAVEGSSGPATLLEEVEACSVRILATLVGPYEPPKPPHDPVAATYHHFEALDARLYPMDVAGGLRSKSKINLVRMSPVDAQRGFSRKDIDQKVAGVGFYHFGAFFKRSWRSNDIMWGRLDGICQLAECLLTRKRLELLLGEANAAALPKIRRRFGMLDNGASCIPRGHPLDPNTLFKSNSLESRQALKAWLEDLLSQDLKTRQRALDELPKHEGCAADGSDSSGPLELLIQMAQYEVIAETLPQVAQDAAEEQLEWNCYPVPESMRKEVEDKAKPTNENPLRFDLGKGTFMEGEGYLEPTEVTIAAAAAAKTGIEKIAGPKPPQGQTPKETSLGKFFAGTFGLKTADPFKSLPLSVLAAIFTQAALVLRNCVLTALGATGQVIEKNSLFRYSVDWPLRALYWWAQWWRRSPASERFWRTLIWCIAIALLAVGILARHPLIFNPGLSLPWFIGLIVLPVTALLVMFFFGTRDRWKLVALLVSLLLATAGLSAGLFIEIQHWLKTVSSGDHTLWSWLDASLFFLVAFAIAFFLGKHRGRTRPLPLRIVTLSELTHGQADHSYSEEVEAGDGTPPYKWTLAGAALPTGLTLSPTGRITGTPTHAGTSKFTLQVTDGRLKTARQVFKIKIMKADSADEAGPAARKAPDAVAASSQ